MRPRWNVLSGTLAELSGRHLGGRTAVAEADRTRFVPSPNPLDGLRAPSRRSVWPWPSAGCWRLAAAICLLSLLPFPSRAQDGTGRTVHVEVAVTRAHKLLLDGRYREAKEEAARLMALDSTQTLRYYHGVACLQLHDWTCAAETLGRIFHSDNAVRFPRLPLELAVALYHAGRLEEAESRFREALTVPETAEMARRYLDSLDQDDGRRPGRVFGAGGAVRAGATNNVMGPEALASSGVSEARAVVAGQSVDLSARVGFSGRPARLAYGFRNVLYWNQDVDLRQYDMQAHSLGIAGALGSRSRYRSGLQAVSLGHVYRPLYLARASLLFEQSLASWHSLMEGVVALDPFVAGERFGRLEEIWPDFTTEGGADMLYPELCAGFDDPVDGEDVGEGALLEPGPRGCYQIRYGVGLDVRAWPRSTRGWLPGPFNLTMVSQRFHLPTRGFSGLGAGLRLRAGLGVVRRIRFEGAAQLSVAQYHRQPDGAAWWRNLGAEGSVSARYRVTRSLTVSIRYGWAGIRLWTLEAHPAAFAMSRYDRHLATAEVQYVY